MYYMFPWAHTSQHPNGILISSAVYFCKAHKIDQQMDTQTD